jgi:hypothetical protein
MAISGLTERKMANQTRPPSTPFFLSLIIVSVGRSKGPQGQVLTSGPYDYKRKKGVDGSLNIGTKGIYLTADPSNSNF